MQYNPDAKRPSFILPPGDYPAQVVNAEEKLSKKGNPMLVVKIKVFNLKNGSETNITDYMVLGGEYSADWRVKELVEASGIEVSGDLNPYELNGRNVKVRLKIKPPKGDFGESNAVSAYMKWDDNDGPMPEAKREDIPF